MNAVAEQSPEIVPHLNDLRVLRMLRATKTKERARFALASLALIRLYYGLGEARLGNLFRAIPGVKESKAIATEGASPGWQREFLRRLVEIEWLSVSDAVYSVVPGHEDHMQALAACPFISDGGPLKRLLWPADYREPEPEAAPVEESAVDEESALAPLLTGLVETVAALVTSMQATAESVRSVHGRMEEVERRIGTKVDDVQGAISQIAAVAATLGETSAKYDSLIAFLADDRRRQLAVMSEKIEEIAGRKRSVINQLEAVTRNEDATLRTLKELLDGDRVNVTPPPGGKR